MNTHHSTVNIQTLGGVPSLVPNRTDQVETGSPHWYISYNNFDCDIYGGPTTALVLGQGEYFLVLNGDHRAAFREITEEVGMRLSRCLRYVREHRDQLNKLSDEVL